MVTADLMQLLSSSHLFSSEEEMEDFLKFDFDSQNLFFRDPSMDSTAGCHFDVLFFLKRASLLLAASVIQNIPHVSLKVRGMMRSSLHFLDCHGFIPSSFLIESFPYFKDEGPYLHFVLMKALYRMFDDPAFLSVVKGGYLEDHLDISPFCKQISAFFDATALPRLEKQEVSIPFLPNAQNHSSDSIACFTNVFGFGASMGALSMNGVEVRAFGPEFAPLGEGKTFGCFRMDGSVEQERGWTRLANPLTDEMRAGGDFLHLDAIRHENGVDLKIKVVKTSKEECFFTFFIAADRLVLASNLGVKKGGLFGYEGPIEPINLYKGDKKVELKASFEGFLKVIPLEGKRYFWGADYLVAFRIEDNMLGYEWSFVK